MTGVEQPKVQYETGESPLLGQRAMVIPYPFWTPSFPPWEGNRREKGLAIGELESGVD